jgi:hypothetical protein
LATLTVPDIEQLHGSEDYIASELERAMQVVLESICEDIVEEYAMAR